jgi:hypothetical protein
VAATAHHIVHPHPRVIHAAVHRAPGVPRAHIHRVHHIAGPARAHPIATHYIRRPIACPSHEIAIASPIPGAAPADTPETLLAELAGPPAARAAGKSGIETAALAPAPAPADDSGLGGLGGGGVPEPSAWALMICGFGAVGAALRRRRLSIA